MLKEQTYASGKKLSKMGGSYALVIDKSIMQLLSFDPEFPVEITTDGEALIVRPTKPESKATEIDDPRFQQTAKDALAQYSEAFAELAK